MTIPFRRLPVTAILILSIACAADEDRSAQDLELYRDQIGFENIQVDELLITAEVVNRGTRVVKHADAIVYLLDSDGRAVAETRFVQSIGPLKPNYREKLSAVVEDPPSTYSGEVRIDVTAVDLADEGE